MLFLVLYIVVSVQLLIEASFCTLPYTDASIIFIWLKIVLWKEKFWLEQTKKTKLFLSSAVLLSFCPQIIPWLGGFRLNHILMILMATKMIEITTWLLYKIDKNFFTQIKSLINRLCNTFIQQRRKGSDNVMLFTFPKVIIGCHGNKL